MRTLSLLPVLFTVFLVSCGGTAEDGALYGKAEKSATFHTPDIKNDFCGVKISFQYCKCAFHSQYCNAVDMDSDAASAYVQSEFQAYLAEKRSGFTSACENQNGFVKGDVCYRCADDAVAEGQQCILLPEEEEVEVVEEVAEEPTVSAEDCEDLEQQWEKYSDIDFRIPQNERSFEAKNYATAQTELVNTHAQQAELLYETEILRAQLEDVKEYKAALVDNLRDNLVKATFRLAYTTYAQVKGAQGTGDSFSKFLTTTESIEALGAGMKSVQALIPSDSTLAIDTNSVGGKIGSIGWNATLEAIDSMGDPIAIGKQIVNDSKGAVMPSADITPEEVEILRVQNLENNLLDDVIAELEATIVDNESWLSVADLRVTELEEEVDMWLAKEKERTLLLLEDECQ